MDEEDLVAFILNGLDDEYEPAISRLVTRVELVTVAEFYSILLNYENRQNLLHDAFANAANHGRGGPPNRGDLWAWRGALLRHSATTRQARIGEHHAASAPPQFASSCHGSAFSVRCIQQKNRGSAIIYH